MKTPLVLAFFLLAVSANSLFAQTKATNPWSFSSETELLDKNLNRQIVPQTYETLKLNVPQMKSVLSEAPLWHTEGANKKEIILTLPMPDGSFQDFRIVEAPVMHPDLGKKYPEIKSYAGYGIDDPTAYLRGDMTQRGFHGMVLTSMTSTVFIDPYSTNDLENYLVYYKKDFSKQTEWHCLLNDVNAKKGDKPTPGAEKAGDCMLRTYVLALACTGEYAQFHGGTTALACAAMNTTMTRVNGVFEKEVSVHMDLHPNTDELIFLNPATDPYTDIYDGDEMLDENQTTCDDIIGPANYDIGHVFSTSGSGLAQLGAVCNFLSVVGKARGVTGRIQPVGDAFDIDFVAHEMGHQFGAEHTFNSNQGDCNGAQHNSTAYEPGSGSTIMAYAGICDPHNVQLHSDDYFHAISLEEIADEVTSNIPLFGGNTCSTNITINNTPSNAYAGANYTIPKSTPFVLTGGTATDPNGDVPTYTWEQMDNDVAIMPPLSTNDEGPMFRSYKGTSNTRRYFPRLADLVTNVPPTWEVLPSVSRTLNFRLTVRDNHPGGGCTTEDDMEVTIDDAAGPFVVIAPNTGVFWAVGTSQTVTWAVAGTTAAPVSCVNVDILLSQNGGLSYPIVLATATPNDGSYTFTLPNYETNQARIMVKGNGNIFFDISDANFTIATCLGSIFFSTQAQIDAFPTNYPGCAQIFGSVIIAGAGITNLNGLSDITFIGGNLQIASNAALTSLTGLGAVTSIVGDMYISNNAALTNLSGLNSLTAIGGNLFIQFNAALTSLTGLNSLNSIGGFLRIYNNGTLPSLTGLNSLNAIGGGLGIQFNAALTSLTGLDALNTVGQDLVIESNAALTSLTGLNSLTTTVGGLIIESNAALTSLTGLNALSTVGGFLGIHNNAALTSLTGLNALTSIDGTLQISSNTALTSLTGLNALNDIGGGLRIYSNGALTSLTGLNSLTTVGELLDIQGNGALTSLTGLGAVTSIGGNMYISSNAALTSLTGLNALTIVGQYLIIVNNTSLTSLTGLNALNTVGGSLSIHSNGALTSLTGLNALASVGVGLQILSNAALTSLTGLNALTSIGGYLQIYSNAALTSLTGLNALTTVGQNLLIQNNTALSVCEVQSICEYLAIPSNPATISGNVTGCASRVEVEAACAPFPPDGSATVMCPDLAVTPTPPVYTSSFCPQGPVIPTGPVITDDPNPLACEGTRAYAYTYTDCLGNVNIWTFTYTIERNPFTVPANGTATVACPALAVAPMPPVVTSNCGEVLATPTPVITNLPNPISCEGTRTYAYSYLDCEGNTATWSFVYTIERNPFTVPANGAAMVACPALATQPVPPVALSNCSETLTPTGPVITNAPNPITCEGTRMYTWTYTDCEGNTLTWSFVYTVERNPFTVPANTAVTVACPALIVQPMPPVVLSNCGETLTPTGPVVVNNPNPITCEGTRTYTWTYTDCEGNTLNWSHVVTVERNQFTVPANTAVTVACPALIVQPVPPTVLSNCGENLTPTGPVIVNNPNPITCEGTRTYTWTYTDCEGNTLTWSHVVTVERNPFSVPANGGATVACPDATDNAPTPPVVLSNCGEVLTPVLFNVTAKPGCEGNRSYTYRYTDCEGNLADWTFIYTVEYLDFAIPPSESLTVECPFNAIQPLPPVVFDNCGKLLNAIGPVIASSTNTSGCEGSRKYVWTYSDCEGNTHTWSKTYIFAYTPDFFVPADEELFVGCLLFAQPPFPQPLFDLCGQELTVTGPTIVENISPSGCSGTRKYTYLYSDCGGHSHPWSFTYFASDNEPPIGNCPGGLPIGANINVTNLACIEDVPCPDTFDFSTKMEELIAAGGFYDVCSGDSLVVELDSWTALWQCSDPDGDDVYTFGRTFYFRIADPCGNEFPFLCGVTYSGQCLPMETYSQIAWGVAGGEPGTTVIPVMTDLQVIQTLLNMGPLVIGGTNRSMTVTLAQCIVDLLPGLGNPQILADCHEFNCLGCNPKEPQGMKNILAANTMALILNMRYNVQYNGLTMTSIRNQCLNCIAIDASIKFCPDGTNNCILRIVETNGIVHQYPFTIGGLLDLSNLYLNGNLLLTNIQSDIYANALNTAIENVHTYWHAGVTPIPCNPGAGSTFTAGAADKISPLGNQKPTKQIEFSLVPNPARKEVAFRLAEMSESMEVTFGIYNQFGQQLLRREFGKVASVNERIDLSGIGQGIYFVNVVAGEQRFGQKLVIIGR